jgi:CheY-like chemotaxis protein
MFFEEKSRVLVVDDEQAIADTLAAILGQSGYETLAAYSGVMAIEMARSFRPHVLLTDVAMPGMTGIEAAAKVREILPACKVLLYSAHATTEKVLEAARAQTQGFELLAKPAEPAVLLAKLRELTSA